MTKVWDLWEIMKVSKSGEFSVLLKGLQRYRDGCEGERRQGNGTGGPSRSDPPKGVVGKHLSPPPPFGFSTRMPDKYAPGRFRPNRGPRDDREWVVADSEAIVGVKTDFHRRPASWTVSRHPGQMALNL